MTLLRTELQLEELAFLPPSQGSRQLPAREEQMKGEGQRCVHSWNLFSQHLFHFLLCFRGCSILLLPVCVKWSSSLACVCVCWGGLPCDQGFASSCTLLTGSQGLAQEWVGVAQSAIMRLNKTLPGNLGKASPLMFLKNICGRSCCSHFGCSVLFCIVWWGPDYVPQVRAWIPGLSISFCVNTFLWCPESQWL